MLSREILLEDLVKRYGQFQAVKGISFKVDSGDIFGFLGPNGAGKSTVSMLTTLTVPTAGWATVGGFDVATQGASFLFFSLSFPTAACAPLAHLSGCIKIATQLNRINYILEAMRSLLNDGWQGDIILRSTLSCVALGVATFAFAMTSLQARTTRK